MTAGGTGRGGGEGDRPGKAPDLSGAWVELPTADDMADLGRGLARVLRPGDVVLLTGPLGAGKTTLTQGLGDALGVRGPITSPTFVIARVHPSLVGGPALLHVDAYRLGDEAELDDLDLDADLDHAVVVVEWGRGIAERLGEDGHLEVEIARSAGTGGPDGEAEPVGDEGVGDDPRRARVVGHGPRWGA